MDKEKYISAINNLKYDNNLRQKTLNNIRININKQSFSWKLKLAIATIAAEAYIFSFGSLICN